MLRVVIGSVALLLFGAGCGSDPVTAPEPVMKQPEPAKCEPGPGYVDPSFPALDVGQVTATVLTVDESPANHALVEVCGVNICTIPEFTDTNGDVAVSVESPTQKPALKVGDAFEFGEYAVLFSGQKKGTNFGTVYVPRLPTDGAPIVAGARAESGGVALTLAVNGKLDIETFAPYDTDNGRAFRAAAFPQSLWPDGLDAGAGLELVFTLAPLGGKLCPPAALELPNTAGWAAGTSVEFLLQGLDPGLVDGAQEFAPYGEWQPFATGEVDATGERLVVTDGGLPVISNVGVRRL